jgi:hypothetical protein
MARTCARAVVRLCQPALALIVVLVTCCVVFQNIHPGDGVFCAGVCDPKISDKVVVKNEGENTRRTF